MPKSRGRNKNHHRRPGRSGDPHDSRRRSLAAEVVQGLHLLRQVNDLERAGDAAGALDLMISTPAGPDGRAMWTRSRLMRLLEIDEFGPRLPAWAWARWIRAQALDCVGPPDAGRLRAALDDASLVGLGAARAGEAVLSDETEARCRLIEGDWVFAQSYLYDHDGLRTFLPTASSDLLRRASGVAHWPDAEMGGFRFVSDCAATITWLRLDTNEEVETLNLGAAATLHPGDHVIGRRVTCGADAVFESPPLAVPEAVATAVSRDPDAWVEALAGRHEEVTDAATPSVAQLPRPSGLLTDLPDRVWEDLAEGVWECAVEERFHDPCGDEDPPALDVLSDACVELVLAALAERRGHASRLWARAPLRDPWPAVGAALQRPGVSLRLVVRMISDGYGPEDLVALGERLGGFARSSCGVGAVGTDLAT